MAFTYFFRDMQTLQAIATYALPQLTGRRYINVWDAGCANGPEPYSLAIILRENMGPFLFRNVKIYATDIDTSDQFANIIASGTYPAESVKRIPPDLLDKYFSPLNGQHQAFRIIPELRRVVRFAKHDLCSLQPIRTNFGLIVCKNVLLHLTPQQAADVVNMFHDALADGGYMAFEQTQDLPQSAAHRFHRVTPQAQLYRKSAPDA